MKKYAGYGNKGITKYFLSEVEFAAIDTTLAAEDLTPGDEVWVEDATNKKMLSAHVYSGTGWRHYLTFDV